MNRVTLIGRLGQDPEVRYTRSGEAVCNMSLATSERWRDRDGNAQERTTWHQIVVFGKQAEPCGQYLSKGRQVAVEGRIQVRDYQDRNGNDRKAFEIVASHVEFLGSKDDAQQPRGGQQERHGGPQSGGSGNRQGSGWGGGGGQQGSNQGGWGGQRRPEDDPIPF